MRGNERMRLNAPESANLTIPLDLIWIPADGGEAGVVVANSEGRYPHVTNDPERIYTSDGHALFSIRYDGTDPRTHLRLDGRADARENSQPTAERIFMHPDGRQALALINKQIWRIAPLPHGDPVLSIDVHAQNATATRLTDVGADFLGWAEEGKSIAWAIGSTVYRLATARAESWRMGSDGLRDSAPDVEHFRVELRVPRAMPEGTLVLRGGNVIPMSAQQGARMLEDTDIVITGNRIVSIGPAGSADIPAQARILDITNRFVIPGFIDTHAHWRYGDREIQDPQNWSLRINLAYGVTAGLDVQSNHGENFAYQDMVETGQAVGTRAFMTGPGVFGVNKYKTFESDFQSYEETLAYLKRYQQHYRTRNIKSYLVGDRRQRQWIVLASQALGLMPTTEGYGDPVLHVTHAIDGMHGNEHAAIDSPLYADFVQTFVRTSISYTPTLNVTHYGIPGSEYFFSRTEVQDDPKLNRFYPRNRLLELTGRRHVWGRENEFNIQVMAAQAAKIQRAGGLIGVGSHGELQGLGYHWEMQMLAMGGMSPEEVLKAATLDGARIIGIEKDLGSLESGKLADLLILRANPLEDIVNSREISYVMQNGVLYDADTLAIF